MAEAKKKILIGYDGAQGADTALADLRRAGLPREANVRVIAVAEPWFLLASGFGGGERMLTRDSISSAQQARSFVEKAATQLRSDFPGWTVESVVVIGSPAETLVVQADEWKADLLVLGSHGHSALGRFFFGSVSHSVVTQAHCSVRIARVRPEKPVTGPDSPVRIVIGVDGSPGAETAISAVASRQWPPGSEVLVVHGLWTMPPVSEEMEMHEHIALQMAEWVERERSVAEEVVAATAERLKAAGLIATSIVKEDEPKQLLLREAEGWDADCIFVGARGRSRLERMLLGSVSTAIVMRAHCSVEVVRA
jgi:nucleotide-binding universal stress UspA family protein